MKQIAILLGTTVLLSGCVAVWGQSYKVENMSESSMTMKFDTNFTDIDHIRDIANKHCERYGKEAVIESRHTSIWNISTVHFTCRTSSVVPDLF